MKRSVNLDDALYELGSHGFWVYQLQDEDTGQMWIDVCQTMKSIHNQPTPHHLAPMCVHQKKSGELVVDKDDLKAILRQPAELPGDYVPEPRYEIPVQPVDISEEFTALGEQDAECCDDDEDDDDDLTDADLSEEFARMAE